MASKALKCWAVGTVVTLVSSQQDTPSPNPVYPKPECDLTKTVSIRYAGTTERLYLESVEGAGRGGCVTLDQIWTARGGGTPVNSLDFFSHLSISAFGHCINK